MLRYLFPVLLLFVSTIACAQDASPPPFFASGVKAGEVTKDSAIIWVRLTESATADFDRLPILTEGLPTNERSNIEMPVDIVPGIAGRARVRYFVSGVDGASEEAGATEWTDVSSATDFVHQFKLGSLLPDTAYDYIVEANRGGTNVGVSQIAGSFRTAPAADQSVPIRFIVSTCQAVRSIDSGSDGHIAYSQMSLFDPHFFVHTGDILYYDKVPLCKTVAQARAKWNLMFAYGHNLEFHRTHGSYFMKDDHDTLKNDCWPGQTYGDLTFDEGLEIFREQVPMGEQTFRTVRWGQDVQIWMTENRDFRSSNRDEDGPDKTILGEEQKAWLMQTIDESDATFKFVITPGPIVGPDKRGKADNHSNAAFAHEGNELREFLSAQENVYVICGDRHWQYCSQDPASGLIEMGCGPINDEHSFGGNPGENADMHRYFSPKGGFLGITVDGDTATAQWFNSSDADPETGQPAVLYSETFTDNE
ncbi:MAG: alkaline phosphatase D family protein [Planctomycetota bacterium]